MNQAWFFSYPSSPNIQSWPLIYPPQTLHIPALWICPMKAMKWYTEFVSVKVPELTIGWETGLLALLGWLALFLFCLLLSTAVWPRDAARFPPQSLARTIAKEFQTLLTAAEDDSSQHLCETKLKPWKPIVRAIELGHPEHETVVLLSPLRSVAGNNTAWHLLPCLPFSQHSPLIQLLQEFKHRLRE